MDICFFLKTEEASTKDLLEVVDKIKIKEMVIAFDRGMKIAVIVRNTELSRSTVNRIIKNHSSNAEMTAV